MSQRAFFSFPSLKSLLASGQPHDDSLTCPVCADVLLDPVACAACQTDLCSRCSPRHTDCNSPFEPSHKILFQILRGLLFTCPFASFGCDELSNIDAIHQHAELCGFRQMECAMGCQAIISAN